MSDDLTEIVIDGTEAAAMVDLSAEAVELARALPGPLQRLSLRRGIDEIVVEWQPAGLTNGHGPPSGGPGPSGDPTDLDHVVSPHPAAPASTNGALASGPDAGAAQGAGAVVVRAPLVGTFYRAPEPGAAPFVEVGDTVQAGQTIAIVEAMKLMNTLVAEVDGTVTGILGVDGQPVEFDQALFEISPIGGTGR